jgi:hypothetical protein
VIRQFANIEALNRLADFIASGRYEFDMGESYAYPSCGTAGCIGGHAAVLWGELRDAKCETFSWNSQKLAVHLGFDCGVEEELCYPGIDSVEFDRLNPPSYPNLFKYKAVTRESAVDLLRRLAVVARERAPTVGDVYFRQMTEMG